MTTLKYIGPAAAVQVPLPPDNVVDVIVEHGKTHEFDEAHAKSLLKQKDNWQEVVTKATKAQQDKTPAADKKGSH